MFTPTNEMGCARGRRSSAPTKRSPPLPPSSSPSPPEVARLPKRLQRIPGTPNGAATTDAVAVKGVRDGDRPPAAVRRSRRTLASGWTSLSVACRICPRSENKSVCVARGGKLAARGTTSHLFYGGSGSGWRTWTIRSHGDRLLLQEQSEWKRLVCRPEKVLGVLFDNAHATPQAFLASPLKPAKKNGAVAAYCAT